MLEYKTASYKRAPVSKTCYCRLYTHNRNAFCREKTQSHRNSGRKVIYTTPATPITAVLARESVGSKREIRRNGAHFVMEYTTIAITFFSRPLALAPINKVLHCYLVMDLHVHRPLTVYL